MKSSRARVRARACARKKAMVLEYNKKGKTMAISSPHKRITKKLRNNKGHKERLTIGKYLLKRLDKFHVRHFFGRARTECHHFIGILEEQPHLHFIELGASTELAKGYAKRNRMGAIITTKELLKRDYSAIFEAFSSSIPLVFIVITKRKKHKKEGSLNNFSFMTESEELNLYFDKLVNRSFLGYTLLDDAESAAKKIDRMLDSCIHHQKPICFELPEEMIDAFIPPHQSKHTPLAKSDPESLRDAYLHIKKLLQGASKPYIVIGQDVQALGAEAFVIKLAEKLEIPIFAAVAGKGIIDETHRLFAGSSTTKGAKKLIDESDCTLFIGLSKMLPSKCAHEVHIFDQEVVVDSISYPHIALNDFVHKLAMSTFPEKKRYSSMKSLPHMKREKTALGRYVEKVIDILDEELFLVATDSLICSEIAEIPLPKGSFLSGSSHSLSLGIGAAIANIKRRPIILINEEELYASIAEIALSTNLRLKPIIIVFSKSSCEYEAEALSEFLLAGRVITVAVEAEFDAALKRAGDSVREFTLIDVSL